MSVRWGTVEVSTRVRPGAETRATADAACTACTWSESADLPTSSRQARLEILIALKTAAVQHSRIHAPAPRPDRAPRQARPTRRSAPRRRPTSSIITLCGHRGCVFTPHDGLHTWQNPPPVHVRHR